jgi:hypothetical protein
MSFCDWISKKTYRAGEMVDLVARYAADSDTRQKLFEIYAYELGIHISLAAPKCEMKDVSFSRAKRHAHPCGSALAPTNDGHSRSNATIIRIDINIISSAVFERMFTAPPNVPPQLTRMK